MSRGGSQHEVHQIKLTRRYKVTEGLRRINLTEDRSTTSNYLALLEGKGNSIHLERRGVGKN